MPPRGRGTKEGDQGEDLSFLLTTSPLNPPLAPSEERRVVKEQLASSKMTVGATYFVVNFKWWQLWRDYVQWDAPELVDHQPSGSRQRPGLIDNSELLEDASSGTTPKGPGEESDSGEDEHDEEERDDQREEDSGADTLLAQHPLRRGLVKDVDYTLFPASVFQHIYAWYGCVPVIGRQAITVGIFQKLQVELHPIVLLCCSKTASSHSANECSPQTFEEHRFSPTAALKDVRRFMAGRYMMPPHKTKLYLAVENNVSNLRLVEESALNQTLEDLGIVSGQILVFQSVGFQLDSSYSSYPSSPSSYRSSGSGRSGWSYAPVSSALGKPPSRGATGLYNLGNTCFMNSALQCLANTTPLLRFFINNIHLAEINPSNPLGMKGELAKKFGELLANLWSDKFTYVVPREFKSVISKFAPQFAGYQQHDSQELLSFVLDGIHEDLNRIIQKPYTEKLEFSPAPDSDDAELAQMSWDTHKLRNNSVIVDHFHGQLKSTVTCQHCGHVSLTFDPFVFLSVPVPSKNQRIISVVLFWRERNPVRYGVRVSKAGTMRDLRTALARLVGLAPERLVMAEVYTHRPFRIPDAKPLFDLRSSDLIFAHEVLPPGPDLLVPDKPQSSQDQAQSQSKSQVQPGQEAMDIEPGAKEAEDPQHSIAVAAAQTSPEPTMKLVNQIAHVPVFHRRAYGSTAANKRVPGAASAVELFGRPLLLSIDRTATTHNDLHRLITERVVRYLELDLPHLNLVFVDGMGYGVGQPVPHDDELFVFEEGQAGIGIDWDRDVLANIPVRKKEFEEDASTQKTEADEELRVSLEDCLHLFTADELLEGSNPWYCSACKTHRAALKRLNLWKCPPVLVVHLKRFQYTHVFRDKVSTRVDFPLAGLDLSPYVTHHDSSMPPIYDLYAVSNHVGSLWAGHYTAFTKNPMSKSWFKLSDSTVAKVDREESVITESAYMLFYINRAFQEQQGLDNIDSWIGEAAAAAAGAQDGASTSDAVPASAANSNGAKTELAPANMLDTGSGPRPKAKEAESAVSWRQWEDGLGHHPVAGGERDGIARGQARGRTNSEGNLGEPLLDYRQTTDWQLGAEGERFEGDTSLATAASFGGGYMGAHRDHERVLDLAMQHHAASAGSRPGGANSGGRGQLRSSLYVCPKCNERVASLDDLQVHVLCSHPESEDLLAVFS